MTTTAEPEIQTFDTPCPDWCTLKPGHGVDGIHDDGRQSRGHAGPTFGAHLSVNSIEFTNAPGVHVPFVELYCDDSDDLDGVGLMLLARHALEAAMWLEIERDKTGVASLATARADAWLEAHQ